eukprot:4126423-Ditylum_brightwellii.AAC.1
METPNGVGEKWKASDPNLTPSKVMRNAVQLNTQAGNEEENSNKDLMKERGKCALDTKSGYQTAVKIEWVMTNKCNTFNFRTSAINLLEKWDKLTQETPLHGPSRVRAFITLFSKLRLDTIKFDNEVYAYLKKHSVYINPGMFKRNDVVSPGIITTVHPTLVRKDNLLTRMRTQLQLCQVPDTKVCNQWLKENAPAHT